jgi:hypothetical protein
MGKDKGEKLEADDEGMGEQGSSFNLKEGGKSMKETKTI